MRKLFYSALILISLSVGGISQAATQAIYWPTLLSGFSDTAGLPLADGTVTVYLNDGSSTTATIWEDANKNTLAANPITLDAYGAKVRYFDGVYRIVLKDSDGNTIKDVSDVRITGEVDFGNLFIDLYSTYGDTASDIQSAISAVGANTATFLWGDHDFIIASNLNFPSNIAHQIQKGCNIQISSGKTVTLNNVIAGGYQFKSGAGTLVIPTANTPIRLPVWSGGTSGVVQSFAVSGSIYIDGTVDGVDVSNLSATVTQHTSTINTLVTSANQLTTIQAQHTVTINQHTVTINQHTVTINTLVTSANNLTTGKIPYTGATGNVSLGSYGLSATNITASNTISGLSLGIGTTAPSSGKGSFTGSIDVASSSGATSTFYGGLTVSNSKDTNLSGGLNVGTATGAGTGSIFGYGTDTEIRTGDDANNYGGFEWDSAANQLNLITKVSGSKSTSIRLLGSGNVSLPNGSMTVAGSLGVTTNLNISGNVAITGTTTMVSTVNITQGLNVSGNATFTNGIDAGGNGTMIKFRIVNIGDWDMDADASKSVDTGIAVGKIRMSEAIIIPDTTASQFYYLSKLEGSVNPLSGIYSMTSSANGAIAYDTTQGTSLKLFRRDASVYDSTSYNDTGYNRGYVTIWYID